MFGHRALDRILHPAPGVAARTARRLADILRTIYVWQHRAAQRRHMLRLDDRLLRDMGISRYDVTNEARKPFWKE